MTFPKLCILRNESRPPRYYVNLKDGKKTKRIYFGLVSDPESIDRYMAARLAYEKEERRAAKEQFRSVYQAEMPVQVSDQKAETEKTTEKSPTISELAEQFLESARIKYVKHGQPTGTAFQYELALRPLVERFGSKPTSWFTLDRLEDYQHQLDSGKTLCREQVNKRVSQIVHVFVWGARHRIDGERIVRPETATELKLIEPLKRGYSDSIDHQRKTSVPIEDVTATLPYLTSVVQDMVRLQILTGARPEEIRLIRPCDIERIDADLWRYNPSRFKTEHHSADKSISIGPRGIEILSARINDFNSDSYVFRPEDSVLERYERWKADESVKKTPSRIKRDAERAANPKRVVNSSYSRRAYSRAIERAAEKAGVDHWTPYQLRKLRATEIDRLFGVDAAKAVLGHRSAQTTIDHYIDPDTVKADEIARKIG